MSKYTTELRFVVGSGVDVFDFTYPIWNESYRNVLEQKIIDAYYFREIGFETIGRFKQALKSKMNRIMPLYNQLYETVGLVNKDNYFKNLDQVTTVTRTSHTGTSGTVERVDDSTRLNQVDSIERNENSEINTGGTDTKETLQDTPQSKLGNIDYATSIRDTEIDNNLRTESENKSEGNVISDEQVQARSGTTTDMGMDHTEEFITALTGGGGVRYNSSIVMEWRESLINIDEMIIAELNELFMCVY